MFEATIFGQTLLEYENDETEWAEYEKDETEWAEHEEDESLKDEWTYMEEAGSFLVFWIESCQREGIIFFLGQFRCSTDCSVTTWGISKASKIWANPVDPWDCNIDLHEDHKKSTQCK